MNKQIDPGALKIARATGHIVNIENPQKIVKRANFAQPVTFFYGKNTK